MFVNEEFEEDFVSKRDDDGRGVDELRSMLQLSKIRFANTL